MTLGMGSMKRAKGIKAVQSLQNFNDLKAEDLSRVISERTVCYCGSYELKPDHWFNSHKYLQKFQNNLSSKLGKLTLSVLNKLRHSDQSRQSLKIFALKFRALLVKYLRLFLSVISDHLSCSNR